MTDWQPIFSILTLIKYLISQSNQDENDKLKAHLFNLICVVTPEIIKCFKIDALLMFSGWTKYDKEKNFQTI